MPSYITGLQFNRYFQINKVASELSRKTCLKYPNLIYSSEENIFLNMNSFKYIIEGFNKYILGIYNNEQGKLLENIRK